jgi:hypothetical protein
LVGTYAVCNGNELPNGANDFASHLCALGPDGTPHWRLLVGDEFVACQPFVLPGRPGQLPRLYAWLSGVDETRAIPRFFVGDIAEPMGLAQRLAAPVDPLSRELNQRLSPDRRAELERAATGGLAELETRRYLLRALQHLIADDSWHQLPQARALALAADSQALQQTEPRGPALALLNQTILEEAFPMHLTASRDRRRTNGFPGKPPIGEVREFAANGDVLGKYLAHACLQSCLTSDLTGDGVEEILATDRAGRLHVLRPDLTPVRPPIQVTPRRHTGVVLVLTAVARLTPGGPPLLVCSSCEYEQVQAGLPGTDVSRPEIWTAHAEEIVILDAAFQPILRHLVSARSPQISGFDWLRVADLDGDGAAELIVLRDTATVYAVR